MISQPTVKIISLTTDTDRVRMCQIVSFCVTEDFEQKNLLGRSLKNSKISFPILGF